MLAKTYQPSELTSFNKAPILSTREKGVLSFQHPFLDGYYVTHMFHDICYALG